MDVAALFSADTSKLFTDEPDVEESDFIDVDQMTPLRERTLKPNFVFRAGDQGLGYYRVTHS